MSKRTRRSRDAPDVGLLEELRAIYEEADALMARWSCDASTACCRFGVTGREPYVTSIEVAALRAAIAARGGPLRKRAEPLSDAQRQELGGKPRGDERTCPLLDERGRCAVYEARPLGCRTFFCSRARAPGRLPRDAIRVLVGRIEALAARHQPDGDRGRPLGRLLGA